MNSTIALFSDAGAVSSTTSIRPVVKAGSALVSPASGNSERYSGVPPAAWSAQGVELVEIGRAVVRKGAVNGHRLGWNQRGLRIVVICEGRHQDRVAARRIDGLRRTPWRRTGVHPSGRCYLRCRSGRASTRRRNRFPARPGTVVNAGGRRIVDRVRRIELCVREAHALGLERVRIGAARRAVG